MSKSVEPPSQDELRAARKAARLSAAQAAGLVGVNLITWQRWEGQTSRKTRISRPAWRLFKIESARRLGTADAVTRRSVDTK